MLTIQKTFNTAPPKMLVHGGEKVGKSTFAAGANGVIFLPTEEGLKGINTQSIVMQGKHRLETYDEFNSALTWLEQNPQAFVTLVIDSADWLETLLMEHICRKYKKTNIAECAGGYGKGYLELLNLWSGLLVRLDRLNAMGKWIVLICHSKSVLFNDPIAEPYDLWTMKLYSPKGQNGSLELIKEWADIIAFAMVEKFVSETETTKALEKGQKKHRAIETGKRLLQFETNQAYLAGNRYGIKKACELTWSAFITNLMEAQNANSNK